MAIGIVLLVASMTLFLYLTVILLPHKFLCVKYLISAPEGRGVRRCIFNGKHCVLYEAARHTRRYIRQYLLTEEDGAKLLLCKTNGNVVYLEYDVVLFDRYNKVFRILNIKESIPEGDYTKPVQLPIETAYVSLVLRRVNRTAISKRRLSRVPAGRIFSYILLTVLIALLQAFALNVSCAYIFGGVFRESFIRKPEAIFMSLALSLIIAVVGMIPAVVGACKSSK